MADQLRIRGQEVQVRLTRNGVLERTLTAIKSLTFTAKFTILAEGFLGETTNRHDEIFTGVGIALEFEPESKDAWSLIDFIKTRASRRGDQSLFRVNLTFVGSFPNGDRPRITTPDLKFGDMPITIGSREAYVGQTLTAECDDFKYSPQ